MKENMLVRCKNPTMESECSSRICQSKSNIFPLQGVQVSFEKCLIQQDIADSLRALDSFGLHIMGTRGHVYRSRNLADLVEHPEWACATMFPRAFGLRAKIISTKN